MLALEILDVSKSYGTQSVLNNVSASIEQGELVTLLGPSGCGKTTLLRSIAGLTSIGAGSILLKGVDVTHTPIHKRHIGMVFQSHALFPNMTVAENVGFGLRMQGVSPPERKPRIRQALELVELGAMADRMPHQLSGGQQQRVAIARAIVINPSVLLLDEPFGALDRKLRATLQVELRALIKDLGITAVFVTHDQEEAIILSDRIAVMNGGMIQQIGSPEEIYESPRTKFVADFMGFQTVLDAALISVDGQHALFEINSVKFKVATDEVISPREKYSLAVRAERIGIAPHGSSQNGHNRLSGTIASTSYRGNSRIYSVNTEIGSVPVCDASPDYAYRVDDKVDLAFEPDALKIVSLGG